VGYFEAWDGYSLEAVLAAAEAERAPVILGFGCMLVDQGWLERGGVEELGCIGARAAQAARVPVSLLLNEAHTLGHALRGIDAGFNAVMLCDSDTEVTARLAEAAHARGVAVEAELGHLPDGGPDGRVDSSHAVLTDPDEAAAFVAATGVDSLAVSFGNVHTLEGAHATIDLDRLAQVRAQVQVPLVAHGGSAFPAQAVPGAIERGVAKFNVGTVLKRTYLRSLERAVAAAPDTASPHDLIGSHGEQDLLQAGKADVTAVVRGLISRYGGSGRA
jgi:fructose-bisphosphate aldolase class II